jgi:hypothetical protein
MMMGSRLFAMLFSNFLSLLRVSLVILPSAEIHCGHLGWHRRLVPRTTTKCIPVWSVAASPSAIMVAEICRRPTKEKNSLSMPAGKLFDLINWIAPQLSEG